ncbi:hypothetical protein CPB85DRAFT_1335136 [Mucidula mucida]|nr:hypothetical protein CPB85DRAFT_1335136 [Mucidula mucida]
MSSPRWDSPALSGWDGLQTGCQGSSSFSTPFASCLHAPYNRATITADTSRRQVASDLPPPINELSNDDGDRLDGSPLSYLEELIPGCSTFPASSELFDLEPNNPERDFDRALRQFIEHDPALSHDLLHVNSRTLYSPDLETIWDRTAIQSDFTITDATTDSFDWQSFLSES